jgi:hypothetical protein
VTADAGGGSSDAAQSPRAGISTRIGVPAPAALTTIIVGLAAASTVIAALAVVAVGGGSVIVVALAVTAMAIIALATHTRLPNALPLAALAAGAMAQSPFIPQQVGAGSKLLYIADLLLPAAALMAALRPSRTKSHDAFVILFGLFMAGMTIVGLLLHGWQPVSQDVRGPAYLIMGYLIGSRLLPAVPSRTLRRGVLALLSVVAGGMLVQLVTGVVVLGGRVEGVRVYQGASGGLAIDATRFITNTKILAAVVVVVAVALVVSRSSSRSQRRWATAAFAPAALITFLGYSRAIVLSLLVALLLLVLMSRPLRVGWSRPLTVVAVSITIGLAVSSRVRWRAFRTG